MPGMWKTHSDHWGLKHLNAGSKNQLENAVGKATAYILTRMDSHKYKTVTFQDIGVQFKEFKS